MAPSTGYCRPPAMPGTTWLGVYSQVGEGLFSPHSFLRWPAGLGGVLARWLPQLPVAGKPSVQEKMNFGGYGRPSEAFYSSIVFIEVLAFAMVILRLLIIWMVTPASCCHTPDCMRNCERGWRWDKQADSSMFFLFPSSFGSHGWQESQHKNGSQSVKSWQAGSTYFASHYLLSLQDPEGKIYKPSKTHWVTSQHDPWEERQEIRLGVGMISICQWFLIRELWHLRRVPWGLSPMRRGSAGFVTWWAPGNCSRVPAALPVSPPTSSRSMQRAGGQAELKSTASSPGQVLGWLLPYSKHHGWAGGHRAALFQLGSFSPPANPPRGSGRVRREWWLQLSSLSLRSNAHPSG